MLVNKGKSMRRTIMFLIVLVMVFFLATFSFALDLKDDEAIVLIKYYEIGRHSIKSILFKKIDSQDKFYIEYSIKPVTKVVSAGHYYLRNINTIFSNVSIMPFEQPKDKDICIKIEPGTITYLGKWSFKKVSAGIGIDRPGWSGIRIG